MTKPFYVLGDINNLLEVLVLSVIEDGIVDDDTINGRVVVASQDCLLNVILSDSLEGILEVAERWAVSEFQSRKQHRRSCEQLRGVPSHSLLCTCFLGPVCVDLRGWVAVANDPQ